MADLEMEFTIIALSIFVDHFEGMRSIAIHVTIPVRNSPVTEQKGDLVGGLRTQGNEIPEHISILIIGTKKKN